MEFAVASNPGDFLLTITTTYGKTFDVKAWKEIGLKYADIVPLFDSKEVEKIMEATGVHVWVLFNANSNTLVAGDQQNQHIVETRIPMQIQDPFAPFYFTHLNGVVATYLYAKLHNIKYLNLTVKWPHLISEPSSW